MGTPKPGADEHQAPPGGVRASVSLLRRNRDFRRLFLASVISLGGDWFLFVAITGLILETTGRAVDVGLAIMAQELAFFLASPAAGVLADRVDRRRLMIVCDLVRAVICVDVPVRGTRDGVARLSTARGVVDLQRALRTGLVGGDAQRRRCRGPPIGERDRAAPCGERCSRWGRRSAA